MSAGTFAETARDARGWKRHRQRRRQAAGSRESKGEFLLFIYELFIRLVELSLLPSSLCSPFSLSLSSSLVLSTNASTNPEGERPREWEKERKVRVAALLRPREGAGNLSFARGGKKATFFCVTAGVALADFSRKGTA